MHSTDGTNIESPYRMIQIATMMIQLLCDGEREPWARLLIFVWKLHWNFIVWTGKFRANPHHDTSQISTHTTDTYSINLLTLYCKLTMTTFIFAFKFLVNLKFNGLKFKSVIHRIYMLYDVWNKYHTLHAMQISYAIVCMQT